MDESKVLAFIKRLSNDTSSEKIVWFRLNDYQNRVENYATEMSYMLFESEFRHIDYHNSYFATIYPGDVFILHEDNESGRNGGIHSVGYKIYLQTEENCKISYLPCPSHALYQLLNAVQASIAKTESGAETFIDEYLSRN